MYWKIFIKTTADFYVVKAEGNSFEDAVNRMVEASTTSPLIFVKTDARKPEKLAIKWDMIESFSDGGKIEDKSM